MGGRLLPYIRPRAVSLSLSPPPETLQVASLRVVEASMGRVAGKASTSSDATRLDSPGPKSLTFASPRGSPSLTNTISKFLAMRLRSEEHTSELQSLRHLVCRLLLEKKKKKNNNYTLAQKKHKIKLVFIIQT